MDAPKVLIVEDQPQMVYALRPLLTSKSFYVDHAPTIDAAADKLHRTKYDVVVLDRNLPDGDGLDLLQSIEEVSVDTRTIVLSEKSAVDQRIFGLNMGADDYVAKPFSSDEFLARVLAVMRRSRKIAVRKIKLGECTVLVNEKRLVSRGKTVLLSAKEFELLMLFIHQPNHAITRERIATALWTVEKYPTSSSIDTCIKRLRTKLADTSLKICMRYNLGYELRSEG